jgi:hypothetical protein
MQLAFLKFNMKVNSEKRISFRGTNQRYSHQLVCHGNETLELTGENCLY